MIQLFRSGTSDVVNGIACERQTVNEFGFEHYLKEGWFFTPEECYPEVKEVIKDNAVKSSVVNKFSGKANKKA
jgi:hypothetical protein